MSLNICAAYVQLRIYASTAASSNKKQPKQYEKICIFKNLLLS